MYLAGPSPGLSPATPFTIAYFVSAEPETTLPTPTLASPSETMLSSSGESVDYDLLAIIIRTILDGIILCAAIAHWCGHERRQLEAVKLDTDHVTLVPRHWVQIFSIFQFSCSISFYLFVALSMGQRTPFWTVKGGSKV